MHFSKTRTQSAPGGWSNTKVTNPLNNNTFILHSKCTKPVGTGWCFTLHLIPELRHCQQIIIICSTDLWVLVFCVSHCVLCVSSCISRYAKYTCKRSPHGRCSGCCGGYLSSSTTTPASPVASTSTSVPQPPSSSIDPAKATTGERAWSIIADGKISLDARLGIFTVLSTNEPRVFQLFPSSSCSCPAKAGCYHMKAAEMVIGMRKEVPKRQLNLTLLRRNKRKQSDKTSGRKRPRVDDVDGVPAPDIDNNAPIIAGLQHAVALANVPLPAQEVGDEEDAEPTNEDVCEASAHSQCHHRRQAANQ